MARPDRVSSLSRSTAMDISIEDAYVALGIAPGAPAGEVKAAWRRLASRWHPDRNPTAEAAALMQRINGAYERILHAHGVDDEPEDAAPAAPSPAPSPGPVLRRRVRLSLEEAALGTTRTLRGRVIDPCPACDAKGTTGAVAGCTHCGGSGQVSGSLWFGWMPTSTRCPQCEGRGQVPAPCADCGGRGHRRHRYERRVRFPAGMRDGDVLNAHVSTDAADSTLELHLRIAAHPFFTVDETAPGLLRCDMPVDGFAWLAETWAEVPTLEGPQQMRLRRGRLTYRLRGQGMPLDRGGADRGDLVVTVAPSFPDTLSPRRQALLEKLAADSSADAEPDALRAWRQQMAGWQRSRGDDA
jgi:molecular chaperone DnaJ